MASSALAFCVHSSLNSLLLFAPAVSLNPLFAPKISTLRSLPANKTQHLKLQRSPRASAEGVPSELIEDSKFVPLNADDLIYGPPAILLLGFELEEAGKIKEFLRQLGGDFLKVIYCTEDMITRTLEEAMNTSQPNLEEIKIMKPLPRICFLSGLSGEEMMVFIDSFPEAGLEEAVFAALVPNSADKLVKDLIEEIMEDYKMLAAKAMEEA